jgi:hypothetical protein
MGRLYRLVHSVQRDLTVKTVDGKNRHRQWPLTVKPVIAAWRNILYINDIRENHHT